MIFLNALGGLLIGTSISLTNPAEPAERTVSEPTSWKVVDQDEDITIYERWVPLADGRKTRERKGVFYVESEISSVIPVVSSSDGLKMWMRGVNESKELTIADDSSKFIYLFFDTPWPFKNRDLVTSITTINNCKDPCIEIFYSATTDYIPEKKDVIRLKSYEAYFHILPDQKGKTQITFSALSDTPPVAPKWEQDPVTQKMFKDNLLNLMEVLTLNKQ